LVLGHVDTIVKFPDSRLAQCIPELFSRRTLTLAEFDDFITVHAGGTSPPFPFKDVQHYYKYAASHQVLSDIRIPFLAFNADDDPLVKHIPINETDNELVVLVITRGGGHLGWFEATGNGCKRWMSQPSIEWLRATAEKIDVPRRAVRDIRIVDGWLVESGREHLGCKDMGEGGRIDWVKGL
jgi:predicted alpha/beta-fold hydrolase